MSWFLIAALVGLVIWAMKTAKATPTQTRPRQVDSEPESSDENTRHEAPPAMPEPVKDGYNRHESAPQVVMDGIAVRNAEGVVAAIPLTLTTTSVTEWDEVFADLNRRATKARSDGDMGLAVDLLQQAKQRQGDNYEDTRLALYLQHAGRLDESMAEFDWLLDHVDAQVETVFGHCVPIARAEIKARRRSQIHDKARLAAQRAGGSDLRKHHRKLAEKFAQECESLGPAAEQAERERRERAGQQAMAYFRRTSPESEG